ncbi:nSTAND1 domain-containing NTPase [Lentzea alba]|nr:helix-turn-helix domain-containing protein [Lentzea alba]
MAHEEVALDIRTSREFAHALELMRKAAGKSLRSLASECDLPFTTISGWCKGRHLPQLSMQREFGRLLDALGVDGAGRSQWFEVLTRVRQAARRAGSVVNPYRGLRAFESDDADLFFGREELTAELVTALGTGPVLVVGPSGSGKSSLLRAGVAPRLDRVVVITPTAEPLRQLYDVPEDAALVVDQLEELFTLCAEQRDRDAFLGSVLCRTGAVVLGLRADFYSHALRHPELVSLAERQVLVTLMNEDQLHRAIVEPARSVGLDLEPGLVQLLLQETMQQSGGLPLLSHTLHSIVELWRENGAAKRTIGVDHYQRVGGVRGAIARTADAAYESLTADQRTAARNLLLRMVRVDDTAADTRRRVTFDELFVQRDELDADDIGEVLEVFVAHRLFTADRQTVEISHEALLTAWPRLREWLAHDRVGHHLHGRLTAAAQSWKDNGCRDEDLFHGGTLVATLEWSKSPGPQDALNPLEREFLNASVKRRDAQRATERRRVRRVYQLITIAVVLLLVASGIGLYARQVSVVAAEDNRKALSREIAAKADRLRDKDPALAAQLTLAAYQFAETPEARSAVLDSSARPLPGRLSARNGTAQVMAAGAALVAIGTDTGQVELWTRGGQPVADLTAGHPVAAIALSADSALLAAGSETGAVTVWRVSDPKRPVMVGTAGFGPSRLFSLAFSPDGRLLAAGSGDAMVRTWPVGGAEAPSVLSGPTQAVKDVAFTPDGQRIAAGSDDATVHLWRVTAPQDHVVLRGPTSRIFAIAIASDGKTLAVGTAAEHSAFTWTLDDPARPPRRWTGPASWVNTVAFSPDGTKLAGGSSDGLLWHWDLETSEVLGKLPHPKPPTAIEYLDRHTLLTLATDGFTRTWTVPGPMLTGAGTQVYSANFDVSGNRLLVGAGDNSLRLWDVSDPNRPVLAEEKTVNEQSGASALSGASTVTSDGVMLISGSLDGTVTLWHGKPPRQPVRVSAATATVQALVISPDGTTLAVGSDDKTVRLVDITDRMRPKLVSTLEASTSIVYGVRFSPDGMLLAAGSADGKGYLWDIADKTRPSLRATITGFGGPVYAAAFSSDGAVLAFGSSDYSVRLVDVSRRDEPRTLPTPLIGPVGEVYELAFHPHTRQLAVSSTDRTVWLWEIQNPERPIHLGTLSALDGLLTVAFSPDGRRLVAGGRDRTVRLWNIDVAATSRWVCETVGKPITPTEWAQFVPGEPYRPPCR